MYSNYSLLISDLARQVQVDPQILNERQALIVNDDVVSFALKGDAAMGDLVVRAGLGFPDKERLDMLALMMSTGNYLGVATEGCTLGLQPSGELVLLWRGRIAQLNGDRVVAAINRVADTARFWRVVVSGAGVVPAEPAADVSPLTYV